MAPEYLALAVAAAQPHDQALAEVEHVAAQVQVADAAIDRAPVPEARLAAVQALRRLFDDELQQPRRKPRPVLAVDFYSGFGGDNPGDDSELRHAYLSPRTRAARASRAAE